jgi:hypothetical protein
VWQLDQNKIAAHLAVGSLDEKRPTQKLDESGSSAGNARV